MCVYVPAIFAGCVKKKCKQTSTFIEKILSVRVSKKCDLIFCVSKWKSNQSKKFAPKICKCSDVGAKCVKWAQNGIGKANNNICTFY